MKLDFCCEGMMEAFIKKAIEKYGENVHFKGWRVDYCPFCGEKIEYELIIRNVEE